MAKGTRPGGGGGGGSVSKTAVQKALKGSAAQFASGNAPKEITINGVKLTGGQSGRYESGGGFEVKTYKYTANGPLSKDGRNTVQFKATNYKDSSGRTARGYNRKSSELFGFEITGNYNYSYGNSGGISRGGRR